MAREPRPLMRDAYQAIESHGAAVVVAPTSYGKTLASPWMHARARGDGIAGGLIHVAPLRSLVWRVYQGVFRAHGGRLQMHGAPKEVKSPYLLSDLVVTTLDSFLWNLYRIPVEEALKIQRGHSMGHYYPALLGILSSLVVFDEGHMYLWENPSQGDPAGRGSQAALAAAAALAWMGVPFMVETATMPPPALGGLVDVSRRGLGRAPPVLALRAPAGAGSCPYIDELGRAVGSLRVVADRDWEAGYLTPWRTEVRDSWGSAVRDIVDDAGREPVLVVANTVREAVQLYETLSQRVDRAVLVHGRLSNEDRRRAEERISLVEGRGGVVVATQVAEAGVDVNSLAVYTAAAPIENLAQRAGRACRRGAVLSACREEGGRVVVVAGADRGPYPSSAVGEALELLKSAGGRIDWRATCNHDGHKGYGSLIVGAPGRQASPEAPSALGLRGSLLEGYLRSDARPWVLLELLDNAGLCGLARDSLMIEVDVGGSSGVPVPLEWALRNAGKILELGVRGAPVIVVEWRSNDSTGRVEGEAVKLWDSWKRGSPCSRLIRALMRDAEEALKSAGVGRASYTIKLKARSGAYKPGIGLL